MIKYAALLRGINVGGNRLIKMEDLRQFCSLPGLKNVRTFIASGNVIFEAKETETILLEKKIEKQLQKCLGYGVKTFIRTFDELTDVAANNPFETNNATIYISFLSESPAEDRQRTVTALSKKDEVFVIRNRELYTWIRKGASGKLLFSNNFIEKNLAVQATTRNWNTVNRLLTL